jgi:thiamine kinase-like enzyme
MMFPFAGVIIDFFDENTNFEKETDRQFYDEIILNMYHTLRVVHGQLRHKSIEERKKMLKEGLIRKEIVLIASTQSLNYCPKYWGKGFTDAVESKVTKFIKSSNYSDLRIPELEYPEILNNLLYEFEECYNSEFGTVEKVNKHWLNNFHNDSRYQNFFFKKLQSGYPKNSMPKMFTKEGGFEDFIKPENGVLPFFVGTQLGIYPKITNELYEKLEGQKIAILGKSLFSGHESGLSICEVKEGKIITLDRFENAPKEKTQKCGRNIN